MFQTIKKGCKVKFKNNLAIVTLFSKIRIECERDSNQRFTGPGVIVRRQSEDTVYVDAENMSTFSCYKVKKT